MTGSLRCEDSLYWLLGRVKGPIVVQRRLYSCGQTAVNNDLGVDQFQLPDELAPCLTLPTTSA